MSSSGPAERGSAVRRVRAVGHRQDDGRRAARRGAPRLERSRSYTSRRPGPAKSTASTIILSAALRFEAMVARGAFLEWADVFGNLYGTGRRTPRAALAAGRRRRAGDRRPGRAPGPSADARRRRRLRAAAVVRGARAPAARAQPGLGGRDRAAAGDGARGSGRGRPSTTTSSSTTSSSGAWANSRRS